MVTTYMKARLSLTTAFRPLSSAQLTTLRPSPRLSPYVNHFQLHNSRRHASSTATAAASGSPLAYRMRAVLIGTSFAASLAAIYLYTTDTRASIHQWLIPPLLRLLYPDAEDAHHVGIKALQTLYNLNLHPRERSSPSPTDPNNPLRITVFGQTLTNPIGISAGLDKDAQIPDPLFALGPAVVEVGGITPLPQEGNPRPRVFRVPAIRALINRYGLNSEGADVVAIRLRERLRRFALALGFTERDVLDGLVVGDDGVVIPPGSLWPGRLLAVQIAKNKGTDEKDVDAVAADYVYCVKRLGRYADVLVVNVSSPNTPGLRDLQAVEPLTKILSAVVDEARRTDRKTKPRVMVKVSPDEDDDTQIDGVVRAVCLSGVDGVIVANTTRRRLVPPTVKLTVREQKALMEDGGFSGPTMFDHTLELVGRYRRMLDNAAGDEHKVIFASGGITNGRQALEVLNAGASIAQVYTGLVYGGSGTITRIKREMRKELGS